MKSTLHPELQKNEKTLRLLKWLLPILVGAPILVVIPFIFFHRREMPGPGAGNFMPAFLAVTIILFILILIPFHLLIKRRLKEMVAVSEVLKTGKPRTLCMRVKKLQLAMFNCVELCPRPGSTEKKLRPIFLYLRVPRNHLPRKSMDDVEVIMGPAEGKPRLAAIRGERLLWGEAVHAEEVRAKTRKMVLWMSAAMLLITLLLLVPLLVIINSLILKDFRRIERIAAWPAAPGEIIQSGVTGQEDSRFVPDLTYQYEVNGRTYTGTEYAPDLSSSSDSDRIRQLLEPYRPGAAVSVLYNPESPDQAYLQPSRRDPASLQKSREEIRKIMILIGLVVFLFFFFPLFLYYLGSKMERSQCN